ncbi:hypothetical protein vseg_010887 [Gypsophila vaccaria]
MAGDKNDGQDSGLVNRFLSPGDHPGQTLTPVQLKGDNYEEWVCMFRGALRAKGKTGYIDGTIKQPSDSKELEHWNMANSMVVSWIFHTIEPGLRPTITYVDKAKTL